jgi:hypothetical protein
MDFNWDAETVRALKAALPFIGGRGRGAVRALAAVAEFKAAAKTSGGTAEASAGLRGNITAAVRAALSGERRGKAERILNAAGITHTAEPEGGERYQRL